MSATDQKTDPGTCSAQIDAGGGETFRPVRCSQPPYHQGLHEADDPADPTHRIQWDSAGECFDRQPKDPAPAATPHQQGQLVAAVVNEFNYLNAIIRNQAAMIERLDREKTDARADGLREALGIVGRVDDRAGHDTADGTGTALRALKEHVEQVTGSPF